MDGSFRYLLDFIAHWEPFSRDLSTSCASPEFLAIETAAFAFLGIISTIAFVTVGSFMILRWKKLWPLPGVAGLKRMVVVESGMLLDADEFRVTRSTQTTSPTSLILADSPTAMYRKAKSIAARRLSKAVTETIYKARTDSKKMKSPDVAQTGKLRKRKYRSQRTLNSKASILTEADDAILKHQKEESDNVKARELMFLQEKRQLKKYVGEMQKEYILFENNVKEAWIQWQLEEKDLKEVIEEWKILKQRVKMLENMEPFAGDASEIIDELKMC